MTGRLRQRRRVQAVRSISFAAARAAALQACEQRQKATIQAKPPQEQKQNESIAMTMQ
jgi:hypothetical protein